MISFWFSNVPLKLPTQNPLNTWPRRHHKNTVVIYYPVLIDSTTTNVCRRSDTVLNSDYVGKCTCKKKKKKRRLKPLASNPFFKRVYRGRSTVVIRRTIYWSRSVRLHCRVVGSVRRFQMRAWSRVKNVLFGVAVGHTLIDTFGSVARVDGISMQPTFNPNNTVDLVFLSYLPIRFGAIERGDIIVAVSPRNPNETIIKRVTGVEGDIVMSKKNTNSPSVRKVVPEGYYWIEGDHKGHTYDSTSFGPISGGLVIAKVPAIIWPPSRWQLLPSEIR